jgi:MFS family permease
LANALPSVLASLFGGAIADRVQKKKILLISQIGPAAINLGIALSLTYGYLSAENAGSWWVLVAAASLSGIFTGFIMPARWAIIPEIVGEQQLMNAVALNNMAMSLLRAIAPAVAGFLIDAVNFDIVYYLMAAMSIISIILIASMPYTSKVIKSGRKVLADIKEGFKYIWRTKTVLFIILFMLLAILLVFPAQLLMPVFTEDILKVGATGLGVLLGISGAGSLVGSVIVASSRNKRRGLILLLAYLISGVALVGFSFSSFWYFSLAMMVILGLAQAFRMTLGDTLVQYYAENKYRGRVMSVYSMNFGITSLGTFGVALIAEVTGVQWAVGGSAMALILLAVLVLAFVPRIRNLD